MAVHGIAGYMSGCRCQQCFTAQRQRERQLAVASETRWAAVVRRIELVETRQQVAGPSTWRNSRVDEQQSTAEVAELEHRRQQRFLKQQQKIARRREAARQRAQAAREMQERYERAVVERDFRWLLAAERRALSSLRTRISRLVRANDWQDRYELLWQQAQQARELAEFHYHQLDDQICADASTAAPQCPR